MARNSMTEGGPTMKRSHKEDSRLYDLRCTICCAVLVLIAAIRPLHAQDILPGSLSCHASGADCDTLCLYSQRTDTVSVPLITFPAAFRQMKENVLTDSLGILNPFWEKLRLSRLGASADTLRIVHVATAIYAAISSPVHRCVDAGHFRGSLLYRCRYQRCILYYFHPSGPYC